MRIIYLKEKYIEQQVDKLLTEYEQTREPIKNPPVPIEEIAEFHLGLTLGFDDMKECRGSSKILGALYLSKMEIIIEESIDPDQFPQHLGLFHFTLGHEIGHFRLHKQLYDLYNDSGLGTVFTEKERGRLDIQADYFSSFLNMPAVLVKKIWNACLGSLDPIQGTGPDTEPDRKELKNPVHIEVVIKEILLQISKGPVSIRIVQTIARIFQTSFTATQKRLVKLDSLVESPVF